MPTRWIPRNEAELAEAVCDRRLVENHVTDFKEQLKPGNSGNKELAKDLASFANDGGLLILGVADAGETAEERLRPMKLEGVAERIDQVARSRLTPPLSVQVHTLLTEDKPTHGYLLVEIAASPGAPHQCDHRYWGRSDTTNAPLSDAEVRAILAARERDQESIAKLLDAELNRDPVPHHARVHGHLYMVAVPRYVRARALYEALADQGSRPDATLQDRILLGEARGPLVPEWRPDFGSDAGKISRRARGWAMHSPVTTTSREIAPDGAGELGLLDLEVDENGALHLLCGRATHDANDQDGPYIMLPVIAGLATRTLTIASLVSQLMGYSGAWDLGIAATGLRGGMDSDHRGNPLGRNVATRYSEPEYRETTTALTQDLEENRDQVLDSLVGRLARGLGRRDDSWIPCHPEMRRR